MMAQFRQEIDTMEVDHVAIRKATVQKSEKGKKVQRKCKEKNEIKKKRKVALQRLHTRANSRVDRFSNFLQRLSKKGSNYDRYRYKNCTKLYSSIQGQAGS